MHVFYFYCILILIELVEDRSKIMGRKALPDSEKKSKIIIIRLTEAEYKQVDEKAWASRRSKSEFARDAINRYLNSADSDKDCLPFSKNHGNN